MKQIMTTPYLLSIHDHLPISITCPFGPYSYRYRAVPTFSCHSFLSLSPFSILSQCTRTVSIFCRCSCLLLSLMTVSNKKCTKRKQIYRPFSRQYLISCFRVKRFSYVSTQHICYGRNITQAAKNYIF